MTTPGYQPANPDRPEKGSKTIFYIIGGVACCLVAPMVVGILAAIAIPNFMKFACKAKQSEAKTNLAGLYTAEKAFYGEYNSYTTDLISLNWYPDGSPMYVYGFAQSGPGISRAKALQTMKISDYDESRSDTANPAVSGSGHYSTSKMRALDGTSLSVQDLPAESEVTADGFIAGAAGDIDTDAGRQLDQWTIDNNRRLTAVLNDCNN